MPYEPVNLVVDRRVAGGHIVLSPRGDLDLRGAGRLLLAVDPVAHGERLVVDLAGCGFIDSSGLRVLMHLDVRAREERWELSLAHPPPFVLELLETVGLHDHFRIAGGP